MSSAVRGTLGAAAMFGADGAQFTSKTVWEKQGAHIDVENPNPGKREGNMHYQDETGKYYYDPATGTFQGMSKTKLAQFMNDPEVKAAIKKGLTFLGEDK